MYEWFLFIIKKTWNQGFDILGWKIEPSVGKVNLKQYLL